MDGNNLAELLQAAAAAAALARLVGLGLSRRFAALLAWLVVLCGSEVLFAFISQTSHLYFWLYVAFVPVQCLLGAIAVRELVGLVFQDYPGIRSIGRGGVYFGVAVAATLSVLAAVIFQQQGSSGSRHLFYLEVLQRSVIFTLSAVIGGVLYFLSRFPLHLSRNTVVSSFIFSALYLSDAVRLLIDSLQPQLHNWMVDWAESALTVVGLTAWTLLLRRESPEPARVVFEAPDEKLLLDQLSSLNRLLSRAGRN